MLDETIILYDLASTYFEGLAPGNKKATHGYSRDHRPDQKQVVLVLVLDREGFPKAHIVLKCNQQDLETMSGMLDILDTRVDNKRVSVVMDWGLATEKNLDMVRNRGYSYIVATHQGEREKWFAEAEEGEFAMLRENEKGKVEVEGQLWRFSDGVLVFCQSKRREQKDRAIRERFLDAQRLKKRVETEKF